MGCTNSSQREPSDGPVPSQTATLGPRPNAALIRATRPNAPLRLPRPFNSDIDGPRTRTALERERQAFFETRVTGRPEIWQAIQLAAEVLREHDVATAQGVLDAAGITIPRGRMEEGVWDEHGDLYRIEEWVIADPEDMIEDDGKEDDGQGKEMPNAVGTTHTELVEGSASIGTMMNVRVRLSDRGTDILCSVGREQHVRALEKSVREIAQLPSAATLKLAYVGRILRNTASLSAQGWQEGHVISALVSLPT